MTRTSGTAGSPFSRDASGEARAATSYQVDGNWERNRPAGKLTVEMLVAADGRAEVERYFDRLPDAADHPVFLADAEV